MNKFIKSDPMLCIGCRTCMIACVVNHTGKNVFNMDPDSYDFTPRVQIQITKDMTKPVQCRQCPKPKCMEACPFNAISMGEDSVILDQDICKGCGKCAKACPSTVLRWHAFTMAIQRAVLSANWLLNVTCATVRNQAFPPASKHVLRKYSHFSTRQKRRPRPRQP